MPANFFASLSYQQCCFLSDSIAGKNTLETMEEHLSLVESNFESDQDLHKLVTDVPVPTVLIRPSAIKYAKNLCKAQAKEIMLDNGIIQRKTPFSIKKLPDFIAKMEKWLQLVDYFIVPDVPLWKFGEKYKEKNIEIARQTLEQIGKQDKLVLPLHFNNDADFHLYYDSGLIDEYIWFAVSCRPFSIFTKRKNTLEEHNIWNKTHLLAFNSTNRTNLSLITDAYSFDSSVYNILAGKFRTMITKNGEKQIVRRMNKTEMILLSLNNAKFYPTFLNKIAQKNIIKTI
ncbi:hypothetical protein [Candidatus Borrarchaeum sp.]|uniref:hypothetical protein n=1 Tax=Candidatus Borrarchaeum sp. TaxID=2846742 RepID=UPI00257C32D4|nr:hypothetical protein [Candidatus Borrarchaeum sp.]